LAHQGVVSGQSIKRRFRPLDSASCHRQIDPSTHTAPSTTLIFSQRYLQLTVGVNLLWAPHWALSYCSDQCQCSTKKTTALRYLAMARMLHLISHYHPFIATFFFWKGWLSYMGCSVAGQTERTRDYRNDRSTGNSSSSAIRGR